jgi:hypothetical protein
MSKHPLLYLTGYRGSVWCAGARQCADNQDAGLSWRHHYATKSGNDTVQKVQELHCEHPSMVSLWALDGDHEILQDLLTTHLLPARISTGVAPTPAPTRAGDGDCGQRCLPASWGREQCWSTKEIDGAGGERWSTNESAHRRGGGAAVATVVVGLW